MMNLWLKTVIAVARASKSDNFCNHLGRLWILSNLKQIQIIGVHIKHDFYKVMYTNHSDKICGITLKLKTTLCHIIPSWFCIKNQWLASKVMKGYNFVYQKELWNSMWLFELCCISICSWVMPLTVETQRRPAFELVFIGCESVKKTHMCLWWECRKALPGLLGWCIILFLSNFV